MTTLLTIKTNINNYKKYNDKYIKIGDENLWKIYIKE